MSNLYERVPLLAAALWWGSLSAIGFMAVPMLFAQLPTPAVAGFMAAKLFAAQTWVSIACAAVLLVLSRRNKRSEEHTSELQSQSNLVCRLLLEKKKNK